MCSKFIGMLSKTFAGTFDTAIDLRLRPALLTHAGLPAAAAAPAAPAAPAGLAVTRTLPWFRCCTALKIPAARAPNANAPLATPSPIAAASSGLSFFGFFPRWVPGRLEATPVPRPAPPGPGAEPVAPGPLLPVWVGLPPMDEPGSVALPGDGTPKVPGPAWLPKEGTGPLPLDWVREGPLPTAFPPIPGLLCGPLVSEGAPSPCPRESPREPESGLPAAFSPPKGDGPLPIDCSEKSRPGALGPPIPPGMSGELPVVDGPKPGVGGF